MTCIVGMIENGKTVIGADSAGIRSHDVRIVTHPKVFKVGEFVIGATSSFRMMQLLRYSLKLPDIKDKEIFEYMCTDFVDAVRECFKIGGYEGETKDKFEGGTFLIGYKDRLFTMQLTFQVMEYLDKISAVGSGEEYSLGAIYAVKDLKLTIEEKLTIGLETASKWTTTVHPPFHFEST